MPSRSSPLSSAGSPTRSALAPLVLPCGTAVPVRVRRHARSKRFVLRVSAGVIQLTIPTRARLRDAERWMLTQAGFVAGQIAKQPAPVPFAEGAELPLFGRVVRIELGGPRGGKLEEDRLWVRDLAQCERLIRKEAQEVLTEEVQRYWRMLAVEDAPVRLRTMTRRWGSCASDGTTIFNWRLAFAPPAALSYVAAHEAAHRIEMNHSRAFWRVLAELMPGYAEQERWLKARGAELHAYGAGAA